MSLAERWQIELERLQAEGRYRTLTPPAGVDFSSNDYLGYSKKPFRSGGVNDGLSRSGAASRLLRGNHPIWDEVEAKLAAWHGAEAALMMTSGYAANEGLLATIIEPGDVVYSDQFNHASIIDGLRLSRAEKVIFPHNNVDALEMLLRRQAPAARREPFIVTESLFGMEADRAPLRELAALAERFGAHLIVDEAHATGCFGPGGSGVVDELGLRECVLASVHTGGKALAVPGAYIVGTRRLKELLVNRCRHLIFTTALPPRVGAWWLDALERVMQDDAGRLRLHERAGIFRRELSARGIVVGGMDYIVSVVMGSDARAVETARRLQEAGFDIRAIRPPTVAEGTARLRIAIHADHDAALLTQLAQLL